MLRLSEALEEHDDVQNVYSNFDVDEKELEAAGLRPRPRQRMRVLGIDCGTERTGYGVIESDGRTHRLRGRRRHPYAAPREPLEARLLRIAAGLREVIRAALAGMRRRWKKFSTPSTSRPR